ncbi:DNA-binding transcriptional regulator, MarR family [Paenibacillus algorifonticola]|uniref:DNA-binding transcriptional regulator, MarR family n=2 Tax=Paenibacillus algorifonticola TaxID=684063 RepID=A0A1I2J2P8_9BACL|nr:DNA-binding transcriptional regulator, MarR family [Paenibacillus algorifonticola]
MQVEMENLKLEYYLKLFRTFEILERKWIKDWNQNNQVGLSKSHIRILGILNDKGPQRPSKLAEDLNITTGGITLLTKKMLDDGYIIRSESHRDRRVVQLEISDSGKDILSTAQEEINRLMENMFNKMTLEEMQTMAALLNKLL